MMAALTKLINKQALAEFAAICRLINAADSTIELNELKKFNSLMKLIERQ